MSNTRRGLPITSSRLERIFPKLIPDQIRRVAAQGHILSVQAGEVLIERRQDSTILCCNYRRGRDCAAMWAL
jgi:hypothetical protein